MFNTKNPGFLHQTAGIFYNNQANGLKTYSKIQLKKMINIEFLELTEINPVVLLV
jgi:hypothetical protein